MGAILAAVDWNSILIGTAIGTAVTVVLSWVFLRVQMRRSAPLLAYRSRSTTVVGSPAEKTRYIEIRYRLRIVPRVTQTRVVLWNAGWRLIEHDDVLPNDPIAISFAGGEILEADIVKLTRTATNFAIKKKGGSVICSFDLLERGDGVVLDLIHTAARGGPAIGGTVKGMRGGPVRLGELIEEPLRRTAVSDPPAILMPITAVVLLVIGILDRDPIPISTGVVLLAVSLLGLGLLVRKMIRRPPRSLLETPG